MSFYDNLWVAKKLLKNRLPKTKIILLQKQILTFKLKLKLKLKYFFTGEHFRGQQYMDGTPYITQCPIIPLTK